MQRSAMLRVMEECESDAVAAFLRSLSREGWRAPPPERLARLMHALDPRDAASLACERWSDMPCSARSMLAERASRSPRAAADMIAGLSDIWREIDAKDQVRLIDAASKDHRCAAQALAAIMAAHRSKPDKMPNVYYARSVLWGAMQFQQRV